MNERMTTKKKARPIATMKWYTALTLKVCDVFTFFMVFNSCWNSKSLTISRRLAHCHYILRRKTSRKPFEILGGQNLFTKYRAATSSSITNLSFQSEITMANLRQTRRMQGSVYLIKLCLFSSRRGKPVSSSMGGSCYSCRQQLLFSWLLIFWGRFL